MFNLPQPIKDELETISKNHPFNMLYYTATQVTPRKAGAYTEETVASGYCRTSENKKEFWIVNRDPLAVTIARGDLTLTSLRVLFHIIAFGGWDSTYRTTRRDLADRLNLSRPALNNAIKLLKERGIIVEARDCGCTLFMVNPQHATQGGDLTRRTDIFNVLMRRQISEGFTPADEDTPGARDDDGSPNVGIPPELSNQHPKLISADKFASLQTNCRQIADNSPTNGVS